MGFNTLTLFGMAKNRLNWLTQRQEVLAQNIANSDTPKYRPSDLKPYDFKQLVRRENMQLTLKTSNPKHLHGIKHSVSDYSSDVERKPFETSPNGNAVILEEQMAKVSETQVNHRFITQIYKKNLMMIKLALGRQ